MPLQQISVSPLDWTKERTNSNQQRQKNLKLQDPVFTTSGLNPLERCPSQASTLSNNNDICRICHCESEEDAPLIAPCYCAGSLRYVHQACLQQWIKSSDIRSCELCKFQFVMQSKLKPFNKWESLEMNGVERRKLLCSVTFHAVALTCVVWSLYVLVDRTVEEIHRGLLEWPFWTKLIVVAIGFAGGVVFMYIQCKAYLHLCRRWRAFNRVIYVQNAPEKVALPPAAAIQHPPRLVHQDSSFASDTCCGVVVGGSDMGRAHPMIINMDPANIHGKNRKTSLEGSPLMSKGECEPTVKTLPDGGGLGDLRVVAATSSGGIRYFDEAERDLNDDLPQSEEFTYEERHLLREVEERSRLLGEVPGFECNTGRIVKAGGFPGVRHASHSNDNISKTHVSPSSSEDSFQLLQNQNHADIIGNVKPASARPWTSLNSGSTRIDKPPPQQSVRPKSSQGSQSPLLTTANVADDAK